MEVWSLFPSIIDMYGFDSSLLGYWCVIGYQRIIQSLLSLNKGKDVCCMTVLKSSSLCVKHKKWYTIKCADFVPWILCLPKIHAYQSRMISHVLDAQLLELKVMPFMGATKIEGFDILFSSTLCFLRHSINCYPNWGFIGHQLVYTYPPSLPCISLQASHF